MKKIHKIIITVLLVTCIIFCSLWIHEKNDTYKLEELCKINVTSALNEFKRFSETGSEGDYWYGVSDFKAFMNSYKYIEDDYSTDYVWCNILYGYMILEPQKVQMRTDQLTEALEYLCEDIYHPQGYHLISVLNNELRYQILNKRQNNISKKHKNTAMLSYFSQVSK